MNCKYKSNTLRSCSYNPKIINSYNTSTLKIGHYTKKKPFFLSFKGINSYIDGSKYLNLTLDKYIYQDECPDSNVIFFNSNLQKYRIDSLGRKQIIDSKSTEKYYSSNTFSKYNNEYKPYKTLNYSLNINQPGKAYRRNENILSNKNRIITNKNILSHGKMNNSDNLSINQNNSYGKNNKKGNISTSYNVQNNRINNLNLNQNILTSNQNKNLIQRLNQSKKMTYNQNQNISLYNKAEQNKYEYQLQNENLKGYNDNRKLNYSTLNKNNRNIRKDILKRVELNESKFGQIKDNLFNEDSRRKPYQSLENNQNNNNFNLREPKTTLLNSKENSNIRKENKDKENFSLNNEKETLLFNTINKENILLNSKEKQQLKENRFSRKQYQNQINQNNNFQNYQKDENFQQISGRKLQNLNDSDNKNRNINQNINKDNQNQNVKIVNKTEEKTIVVLPGQTIEPKTINETFQKPIVETIENEDGTTSSIIKQTKITTISENVPIGNEKIKSIEGAPDLPMVKQYITYEFKTVSSPREGKIMANQILKSQNKVFEEDKLFSENQQVQNSGKNNSNEDLGYNNAKMENEGILRNYYAYDEENLKEEINQHNLHENESEENKPSNLNKEKLGEIKGNQGDIKRNEGENMMKPNYEDNKDNQKFEEKSGYKKNNINCENNELNDKGIQGDNYIQSGLKEKQLDENPMKSLDSSKNNKEKSNEQFKKRSEIKNIGLSEKGSKSKSEGKNTDNLKYGKGKEGIINDFSSSAKKSNKKEEKKNLEKYDKNKEGVKSMEKSDKNNNFNENKYIMKNIEKSGKNLEDNNSDKKSLDKKKKLDNAIAAVGNPLKESLKILCEGPQTKEEKLIIDIIKKGGNATPEEKQKKLKFLSDLYRKCCQKGNKDDKEKNIEKLGLYLTSLGDSEKKQILPKLKNIFPDNEELYKKLIGIISKKSSLKPKGKKEDKYTADSLNKNAFNMELENKNNKKKGEKKIEGIKGYNEISQNLNIDFNPEKVVFENENIRGKGELSSSLLKGKILETIEIKNVNPLKFDGLFLEISKYESVHREKNPFEGPSPFDKFYKIRKSKIKKKIISMANEEINDEKMDEKNKSK